MNEKRKVRSSACVVYAIANQKGGVGKSTVVANLGIGLTRAGKSVLLIDADPQGSLTASLGFREPDEIPVTVATIMTHVINEEDYDLQEGILHNEEGVDLLPANIGAVQQGYTIVPLKVYFKGSLAKAEIGLVRGKKQYDKRADIAKRDARRAMDRAFKEYNR